MSAVAPCAKTDSARSPNGQSTDWLVSVVRLLAGSIIAGTLLISGQSSNSNRIWVTISALGAKGDTVADLTAADFQIFDEGKPKQVVSLQAVQAAPHIPATTLTLFDLLNSRRADQGYVSTQLVHNLQPLETGDSVYLYLLTDHGDIFPVHALAGAENAKPDGSPWTTQIHPLLDESLKRVYGLKPMDDRDVGVR